MLLFDGTLMQRCMHYGDLERLLLQVSGFWEVEVDST